MTGSSGRAASHGEQDDGVISVVLALTMVLFVALLAVVIDLGQIQGARSTLAAATTTAVERAAGVLAREGCASFDAARDIAEVTLNGAAATAALEEFIVTYGAVDVDDVTDCVAVANGDVGRVSVTTSDDRAPVFSPAFTSNGTSTSAQSSAEWGYVESFRSGMRPMSMCGLHPAYLDFLQYLAEVDTFEALGAPVPNAALLDPFDIELDGFEPHPSRLGSSCNDDFGELVNIDFEGQSEGGYSLTIKDRLRSWVADGTRHEITLTDCGTGTSGDTFGQCVGVSQGNSLDEVADVLSIIEDSEPRAVPILIHLTPACDQVHGGPDLTHCLPASLREHRVYPTVAFARVEVLCARITRYASAAVAPAEPPDDPSSPAYGSDCVGLTRSADVDGSPGDDVMLRLRFVAGGTIRSGRLTSVPNDNGFLGVSVCAADGLDKCTL